MRVSNSERTEPFLKKLGRIRQCVLGLRFGQMLEVLKEHGRLHANIFSVEDDDLEKAFIAKDLVQ